ncbi:MAG: metal-sensitive transcriptional regulator [Alphaproteobacteria bacterium]|nr:metal-sensitive transcriptional regulator [Alphaproteobacteria bacterium]
MNTETLDLFNEPDHTKELGRLNRILGQIEGIKKMIIEHRDCADIMSQLRAARSAIRAVEANVLKTHLQHCVVQSFNSEQERQQKIDELRELFNNYHE